MKNKKYILIILVVILLIIFGVYKITNTNPPKSNEKPISAQSAESQEIEYWTCSMHPQVRSSGPGKCPICAMTLIPVYRQDAGKILVGEDVKEKLGIKSQPAEYRNLVKIIRLPGKVSHDYELYVLEQEYLSSLENLNKIKQAASPEIIERQRHLLEAVKLRLKLLGFHQEQIKKLEGRGKPDESLIYPTAGRVWIHADIYEQDLSIVKLNQTIKVKIKGYEEDEFTGNFFAIEEVLNPHTRSAKARIEVLDPQNKLKHEVFADLILEVHLGNRLSIPKASLIDTGTRKVVYLDLGQGRYQLKEVKIGQDAQDYVEVLEGLKENDLVVSDGNFLLDSQSTLTGGQSLLYGAGEEVKR